MSRPRLAIVGTGVAGLGSAHFLHPHFDLTIFEQNDYAGGHTNTVTVREDGRELPVDTGFMVFNHVTYPLLTRLFKELDVATKPTSMSFSVSHLPSGIEYNGTSLNHLFGQRRNLISPRFWRFMLQINRFNAEAVAALEDERYARMTLREYVEARGYGSDFLNIYIIPMSSAVWSTPPELMLEFPALTLIRFWHNHGFLGLHTQHPWWTVTDGARSYVKKLTVPFRDRIRLGSPVVRVERGTDGVKVYPRDGAAETFDKVVFASHADQTLRMLAQPTERESALLGCFKYQPNIATLHTDESFMPRTKKCWASWNYRIRAGEDGGIEPSTHYWMNSLQGVSDKTNYFVAINAADEIAPEKVLKRINYEHPLFDLAAIDAQKQLPELNRISPDQSTYFCGSYFRYGFHEDAFGSAVALCRDLLGREPW
ncbi:NAD(P)/FAD-dependent oxidoreductase [Prosthecobacter vanneervenii]|uniref:Putative NAD/FAD-binding protein n=1 Tax=Prosthecobacter vanneervenii TaxID=48466 RepID=A0A7W8DM99_9BACT|nr:FAD-dependent oxidoreductase [Prosthecobacter vanneervenii]MBB5034997.1 putative NAD/FAD-binding protein [Prosthecobacter vanneervenii]